MRKFLLLITVYQVLFSTQLLALDYDYGKAENYKRPTRKISIIAAKNAYYPDQLIAFVGEKVVFYVTGTDSRPACFMMPEKEIFIGATKGELTKAEALFDRPGVYKFYCPKGELTGHLTVLLHPKDKKKLELREIASRKIIKVWRPKEE